MRWLPIAMALSLLACGTSGNGNGDDDDDNVGEPLTGVFLFNRNGRGMTVMQGQVAAAGAIGVREPELGCSHPGPDEPWALADFVDASSADLRNIGDVALVGFPSGNAIGRYFDPPYYRLLSDDVPYPDPGTRVSIRADDERFQASLTIGEPPVVTAPTDGTQFFRTEPLLIQVQAPGATGILIDFDFPEEARLLCFFAQGGDITIAAEDIAFGTFGLSGPVTLLVGTWVVGSGGTDGVEVHLVSSSTASIGLNLGKS